ncbi:MAG: hypothetical protein PHQ28_00100 [Mycobacterium sp.]|nr:hypothetical protein [Mycobacterium sp.]
MPQKRTELHIPPRQPLAELDALTILVCVPGDPAAVRAFTAAEADEARRYAAEHGGCCEPLPLAPANASGGGPPGTMAATA